MVCEKTALVAPDAQVVDEQAAGGCGVGGGVEGAVEGGEERGDGGVEFANFADGGADEVGLVGGEGWEG